MVNLLPEWNAECDHKGFAANFSGGHLEACSCFFLSDQAVVEHGHSIKEGAAPA
jgi:hypothetical protein